MDRLLLIVNAVFTLIFAVLVVVLLFDVSKIETRIQPLPDGHAVASAVTSMSTVHSRLENLDALAATLQKQVDNLGSQLQAASQTLSDMSARADVDRDAGSQAARVLLDSATKGIAQSQANQARLTQQTTQLHQAVAVLESRLDNLTQTVGATDMAGDWVLQLPLGETHDIVLVDIGNDRYEMQTIDLNLGGVYRLEGQRLVMVRPNDREMMNFVWTLRNESTLDLTREPDTQKIGTSYLGATLTRP